ALCRVCGTTQSILQPTLAIVECENCAATRPATSEELLRGSRVSADNPVARPVYRNRAKPLAANTTKINMRVRPKFRHAINAIMADTGWTMTQIIETAVERLYRESVVGTKPIAPQNA